MNNKTEMITSLTDEQIGKFPEYVKNGVSKGLSTKQMTQEEAELDFNAFQTHILEKKELTPVILLTSPRHCWIAIELIKSNENYDLKNLNRDISNIIAGKKIKSKKNKIEFVYPYFDCQFWAGYFSYFDFFKNECGIVYNEKYEILKKTIDYGMVFVIDECCIVSQPFTTIHKNASGLHCEDGPALSYSGHCEVYALNGVRMKKEYVLTPAEYIKADDILKETNVEIRRELIRKVGIEMLLNNLPHKLLEKSGNYELYSIELSPEIKDARYLKMLNPSVDCFHMEGIDPSISTISDALKWRNNNLFENAEILT